MGDVIVCQTGKTKPVVQTLLTDILQRGGWECPWFMAINGSMSLHAPIGSTKDKFEKVFEGITCDDYLDVISKAVDSKELLSSLSIMERSLDDARNLVVLPKLYDLVKIAARSRKKKELKDERNKKGRGKKKHKKQVQSTLSAIYSAGNKTDPLLSKTGKSSTKSSAEESKEKVKKGEKKQGKGDGKKAKKDKKKPRKESKEAP